MGDPAHGQYRPRGTENSNCWCRAYRVDGCVLPCAGPPADEQMLNACCSIKASKEPVVLPLSAVFPTQLPAAVQFFLEEAGPQPLKARPESVPLFKSGVTAFESYV